MDLITRTCGNVQITISPYNPHKYIYIYPIYNPHIILVRRHPTNSPTPRSILPPFSSRIVSRFFHQKRSIEVMLLDSFLHLSRGFLVGTRTGPSKGAPQKKWVFPKNRGKTPQIIHFNGVFHYKPSILGYPYYWKHPNGVLGGGFKYFFIFS